MLGAGAITDLHVVARRTYTHSCIYTQPENIETKGSSITCTISYGITVITADAPFPLITHMDTITVHL